MKTITVGKHVFEIVNDIPLGYRDKMDREVAWK